MLCPWAWAWARQLQLQLQCNFAELEKFLKLNGWVGQCRALEDPLAMGMNQASLTCSAAASHIEVDITP